MHRFTVHSDLRKGDGTAPKHTAWRPVTNFGINLTFFLKPINSYKGLSAIHDIYSEDGNYSICRKVGRHVTNDAAYSQKQIDMMLVQVQFKGEVRAIG
jgi:hypothetical protein